MCLGIVSGIVLCVLKSDFETLEAVIQDILGCRLYNWHWVWDLFHADFMADVNRVTSFMSWFPRDSPNSLHVTGRDYSQHHTVVLGMESSTVWVSHNLIRF